MKTVSIGDFGLDYYKGNCLGGLCSNEIYCIRFWNGVGLSTNRKLAYNPKVSRIN